MDASIEIIPVSQQDFAGVATIYNHYIAAGNVTMEERIFDADSIAMWVEHFTPREQMWVILRDNQLIGWGVIKQYSDRAGYATTCETSVYLHHTELSKGYGTMLKRHLMAQCKELGYHHIVAKIWADNKVSIDYNLKLGYEIVGVQKEVGRRNNQWVDVVLMQYLFR